MARRKKDEQETTDAAVEARDGEPGEMTAPLAPVPKRGDATGFAIVGIGASAGGLEALEQFLQNVPPASNLAFVIVQHLDPTHKDIMVELLQRCSSLPVVRITDRMRVEPDHVYIIPPNRDLALLQGVLHLLEPNKSRGPHLPIDHFLRSLAEDQLSRSIGVILSGMGSDGTLGLRAIKEKAGAAFVQSPSSAKYDGMPRSAIDAGLADVVAPVEELCGRILQYLRHVPLLIKQPDVKPAATSQSGIEKVILLLRTQTGHDFSHYKKTTLYRRIERRMGLHQLNRIADYVRFLRSNTQEIELLFKELLIGVTSFFRDPAVWEQLKKEVMPALLAAHPKNSILRAWVPACSTGEEAYSLAIVFREALDEFMPSDQWTLQIFATDLDKDSIDKARTGFYPPNIAADVSEERLHRFFTQEESGFRVNKEIREMVVFAPQNLIMDPPFTRLDLLTCRNLLIYLETDLQKKLLPLFHYSLNPGGVLVLGTSETVGQSSDLFTAIPDTTRIYRRVDTILRPELVDFPLSLTHPPYHQIDPHQAVAYQPLPLPNLQALTDEMVLRRFSPAAVLTTSQGDIVYTSAKTGKYLEPSVGKANLNIFVMAREGLAGPLSGAFAKAIREKTAITLKGVKIGTNGGRQAVNVIVQHLDEPVALRGMILVVFQDLISSPVKKATKTGQQDTARDLRLTELADELQRSREEVQIIREEMQTSQEELKSANEELQIANEELQSTNEELNTSKEEMQSMNEELQTVNHELTAKVDELSRSGDDMNNLLNSINLAILFLDDHLNVRRFTIQTTTIFKLIPADTGRPITDVVSELDYPEMANDVRNVLRTLVSSERRVSARDGRWFLVRIKAYRTQGNRIDGVVITFTDISSTIGIEATLAEALAAMQTYSSEQTGDEASARILKGVMQRVQAMLEKSVNYKTIDG